MPVNLYTTGDGTVFAVHEASDGTTTVYELSIEEDDGERKATVENVHGARARNGTVSDAVSEALEAAGYTLDDDPCTDGGCRDESMVTIREALEAAKDADPDDRDEYITQALGEVAKLQAQGASYTSDVHDQIVSVLTEPDEEAPFYINQSLRLLENIEGAPNDGPATETKSTPGTISPKTGDSNAADEADESPDGDGGEDETFRDEFKRTGDQLAEVFFSMDEVDLNPLLDDDVRTILDAKADLYDICQRARQNQHAVDREGSL